MSEGATTNEDLARMIRQLREDAANDNRQAIHSIGQLSGTVAGLGTNILALDQRLKTVESNSERHEQRIHESDARVKTARDSLHEIEEVTLERLGALDAKVQRRLDMQDSVLSAQNTQIAEIKSAVTGEKSSLTLLVRSDEERRIASEIRDKLLHQIYSWVRGTAGLVSALAILGGALWFVFKVLVNHVK